MCLLNIIKSGIVVSLLYIVPNESEIGQGIFTISFNELFQQVNAFFVLFVIELRDGIEHQTYRDVLWADLHGVVKGLFQLFELRSIK